MDAPCRRTRCIQRAKLSGCRWRNLYKVPNIYGCPVDTAITKFRQQSVSLSAWMFRISQWYSRTHCFTHSHLLDQGFLMGLIQLVWPRKLFMSKGMSRQFFLINAKVRMRFTLHVQPFIHVVTAMRCKTSLSSYKTCQCIRSSCLRVRTVGLPTRRRLPTKASERHSIELSIASAVLSRPWVTWGLHSWSSRSNCAAAAAVQVLSIEGCGLPTKKRNISLLRGKHICVYS